MKDYIDMNLEAYKRLYEKPIDLLKHLFATLGNGVSLTNSGYLGYKGSTGTSYKFGEPVQLSSIYPWDNSGKYQPFRKYAGCRNTGFKEAAKYFIDCVMITPDSVQHIKDWKDNITIVEDVLLNTPIIEDKYSIGDIERFLTETNLDEYSAVYNGNEPQESVSKVWLMEDIYTDCPKVVGDEIRILWRERELGNDDYIARVELNQELFDEYPKIYFWLQHKGVKENERVLIHHWW